MSGLEIIDFLMARIAEGEESIQAVWNEDYSPRAEHLWACDSLAGLECDCTPARRVLATCRAHRLIIAEHAPTDGTVFGPGGLVNTDRYHCTRCCWAEYEGLVDWPCPTIGALAGIWSDHSDYQQEWTP